jgi:hypothetical protein
MERITMPETGVEYFLEDGTYTPVKKTCIFEELGGTYRMEGRFLMPNVKYPDPEPVNYGMYGDMRLEFLEENEIDELSQMMYAGTLGQHLKMIDDQANERWDRMEEKLEEIKKTPEMHRMWEEDWLGYVGLLTNLRETERQKILRELVYS